MEFTTEMTRIGQAIRRAAEERTGRLGRIRADAQQLLTNARARVVQLASDRRHAAFQMADAVGKARTATALLKEARRKQAERDAPGKTRRDVLRIRAHTARFLKESSRRHEEASNRTKDGLVDFVAAVRGGVGALLKQSHRNMQDFAADFRRGGRLFRRSLRGAATPAEQGQEQPAGAKSDHAPRHNSFEPSFAPAPRSGRGAHRRNAHS